jgi:phosphoenolpyruvate phosphomutase
VAAATPRDTPLFTLVAMIAASNGVGGFLQSRAETLRQRLAQRPIVLLAGAHDALSARLASRSGFDGVWASGLGISAVHGVPDASILTMTEFLRAAAVMAEASPLPVVADCDTGFGDLHNVMRMVESYERAGIAGVAIEDKVFPKRNSLGEGEQALEDVEVFCGRVAAAKQAQDDPAFVVMARLEALIAGQGIDEAYRRARAYEEAGADLILVHSRRPDPSEVLDFARRWDSSLPLGVIPTTYPTITASELEDAGFKLCIYANQAVRAAIRAMDETLETIAAEGTSPSVEDRMAPLSEVFELQGVREMEAAERAVLASVQFARSVSY